MTGIEVVMMQPSPFLLLEKSSELAGRPAAVY
jgi:hypothetical protein